MEVNRKYRRFFSSQTRLEEFHSAVRSLRNNLSSHLFNTEQWVEWIRDEAWRKRLRKDVSLVAKEARIHKIDLDRLKELYRRKQTSDSFYLREMWRLFAILSLERRLVLHRLSR